MEPTRTLLITVHGIQTFGHWQERLEALLGEVSTDIECQHYKYGYFTAPQLLIPLLRWVQVIRFKRSISELFVTKQPSKVVIVAHSFGTHVVGHALGSLQRGPNKVKVDTVIFAGSVLLSTFNWERLIAQGRIKRIINDCSPDDGILLLNQAVNPLSGMAGRLGFVGLTGVSLFNRYFRGGHSCYFERNGQPYDEFMRKYWVPLILGERSVLAEDQRLGGEGLSGALRGIWIGFQQLIEGAKIIIWSLVFWGAISYPIDKAERVANEARDAERLALQRAEVAQDQAAQVAQLAADAQKAREEEFVRRLRTRAVQVLADAGLGRQAPVLWAAALQRGGPPLFDSPTDADLTTLSLFLQRTVPLKLFPLHDAGVFEKGERLQIFVRGDTGARVVSEVNTLDNLDGGYLVLKRAGVLVVLTPKHVEAYGLESGKKLWRVDRDTMVSLLPKDVAQKATTWRYGESGSTATEDNIHLALVFNWLWDAKTESERMAMDRGDLAWLSGVANFRLSTASGSFNLVNTRVLPRGEASATKMPISFKGLTRHPLEPLALPIKREEAQLWSRKEDQGTFDILGAQFHPAKLRPLASKTVVQGEARDVRYSKEAASWCEALEKTPYMFHEPDFGCRNDVSGRDLSYLAVIENAERPAIVTKMAFGVGAHGTHFGTFVCVRTRGGPINCLRIGETQYIDGDGYRDNPFEDQIDLSRDGTSIRMRSLRAWGGYAWGPHYVSLRPLREMAPLSQFSKVDDRDAGGNMKFIMADETLFAEQCGDSSISAEFNAHSNTVSFVREIDGEKVRVSSVELGSLWKGAVPSKSPVAIRSCDGRILLQINERVFMREEPLGVAQVRSLLPTMSEYLGAKVTDKGEVVGGEADDAIRAMNAK